MKANRPHRIIIERAGPPVDDTYTTTPGEWAEWCQEYAAVYFGTGAEQRQAAQEQAAQTASFEVLSNAKTRVVSVGDRIVFDGGTWDITAHHDLGFHDGVRITAVRAAV